MFKTIKKFIAPRLDGRISLILSALFVVMLVGVAIFAASGNGSSASASSPENTDPRVGIVYFNAELAKQCYGTTLVWQIDRGGNAIPNSPECQPR